MASGFTVDSVLDADALAPEDLSALEAATAYSFNQPAERAKLWLGMMERLFVSKAAAESRCVGGCGVNAVGLYVGGKSVPMEAITAVSSSPFHRGTGAGRALLRGVIASAHERGVATLGLYASTIRFYRSLGFENAVTYPHLKIATASFAGGSFEGADEYRVREMDRAADEAAVAAVYARAGAKHTGYIDRNSYFWRRIHRRDLSTGRATTGAVVESVATGEVAGYLVLRASDGNVVGDLTVTDCQADTAGAWAALARFLSQHGTMNAHVDFAGSLAHPLMVHARTPPPEPKSEYGAMMLRIVDVPAALEARGYNALLAPGLEVHLDVRDADVPANNGRFLLRVDAGAATVERGAGDGAVALDVRALAMLFTGYVGAEQLLLSGLATFPPEAVDVLDAVFGARGTPLVLDHF